MKYVESFKKNNNPFNFNGAMGRLHFLGYNFLFMILSSVILWQLCPKLIVANSNPDISKNKATIELLLSNSSTGEVWIYVISTLVFMLLSFILNKKRFLDIIGENINSLRMSVIYASVLFLLALQGNFFTPLGTTQAGIVGLATFFVYIFMYLKKGAITGKKEETLDVSNAEQQEQNAVSE